MTEAERQAKAYADVKARLFGKPASTNKLALDRAAKARRRQEAELREALAKADEEARIASQKRAEFAMKIRAFRTFGYAQAAAFTDYPTVVTAADFPDTRPTMEVIAAMVLRLHPGISLAEIKGTDRHAQTVAARRDVIATIHKIRPDLSLPRIGHFLNKDHTTVLHAIRRHAQITVPEVNVVVHGSES